MRFQAIKFDKEDRCMAMFLELPKRLYSKQELMQNEGEERQLLSGTHALSRYFTVHKFLVLDREKNRAAARAVLTLYPEDENAYIGYFESEPEEGSRSQIETVSAAECLFTAVKNWARENGFLKIVGPVNTSFWTGYRLKTDHFECPYTGEPYNLEYYGELFRKAGFNEIEHYKSNRFKRISRNFDNPKFADRLAEKTAAGYEIRSPHLREFEMVLSECYSLISRLYQDFPVYKQIGEAEFMKNYGYLKYIIDCRMIKLAYYRGELKGFFISIPNYGNRFCGRMTPVKLAGIIRVRFCPSDYVMLYMGVDGEHRGLGKALSETVMRELKKRKALSIGALIHGDKVNGRYFEELIECEYHYVLMQAELERV